MAAACIVFFGRNPAILALVKHQLSALGHAFEGYLDENEMNARLRGGPVALLVLGVGVEHEPRMNSRALRMELGIRLYEHEGGPDNLIRNVEAALAGSHT